MKKAVYIALIGFAITSSCTHAGSRMHRAHGHKSFDPNEYRAMLARQAQEKQRLARMTPEERQAAYDEETMQCSKKNHDKKDGKDEAKTKRTL